MVSICTTCYTQGSGPLGCCWSSVCPHHVVIIGPPTLLLRIWISVYTTGKPLSSMMCLSWGSVCEQRSSRETKRKRIRSSEAHYIKMYFQRVYVLGQPSLTTNCVITTLVHRAKCISVTIAALKLWAFSIVLYLSSFSLWFFKMHFDHVLSEKCAFYFHNL